MGTNGFSGKGSEVLFDEIKSYLAKNYVVAKVGLLGRKNQRVHKIEHDATNIIKTIIGVCPFIPLKDVTANIVIRIRKTSELQSHFFASKIPLQFIICHQRRNAPAHFAVTLQP